MPDRPGRAGLWVRFVAMALRIVAEAGWITVIYGAVSVIVSRHPPAFGPLELSGAVLVGWLVARWGRTRPELGALLLIVAVLMVGALGWLASGEARTLLPSPPRALGTHLAGWLAGAAVVRGSLIGGRQTFARELESSMRVVPVVLALVWAYTSLTVQPPLWLPFAASALWGTIVYFAAALPAIGWARLDQLHANVADQRRRRDWRWLVTAVGFGAVPVALPLAIISGIPADQLLKPIVGPLQWLVALVAIPLSWIIWLASELLRPFVPDLAEGLSLLARGRRIAPGEDAAPDVLVEMISTTIAAAMMLLSVAVVLFAIFLFARWLITRGRQLASQQEGEADIERSIMVPVRERRRRVTRPRPVRHAPVRDAVSAYLGALRELEKDADLARLPNETPARHAARLSSTGVPAATDFARLAASYQLARYGERRITPSENVRAVGRFKRLRKLLRAPA